RCSAAVGDGGHGGRLGNLAGGVAGDEHVAGGRAHGDRGRVVVEIPRVVVAARPPLGTGSGVVGDGRVVHARAGSLAFASDVDGAPVRADGDRLGGVVAGRAVVAALPQRGTGHGVVADGGVVLVAGTRRARAGPGDEHRGA